MSGAESVTVETDDGRVLDVLVSGPADGTVLLLHTGTPAGLVPLPPALDLSGMGIRTVLYARPGYGGSTPHVSRTVADAASDTAAILDALGVNQFLNAGWSGGGPHALACDAVLGDRCLASAIIASPAPYVEAEGSTEVRGWYESDDDNQLAFAGEVDAFRRAVDGFVQELSRTTAEGLEAGASCEADRKFFSEGNGEWVASFFRASSGQGTADDFLATFSKWGFPLESVRPVTIWHGTEDRLVPPFHAEWLAKQLPQADLRLIEEAGHCSVIGLLPKIATALLAGSRSSWA